MCEDRDAFDEQAAGEDTQTDDTAQDSTDIPEEPDAANGQEPNPEAELDAERERYVRLYAEYENFRKRSKKERETVFAEVRAETLLRMLPVFDNLERAAAQETGDEAYRRGVEMILAQMTDIMTKMGVAETPGVGEKFDPAFHEAVMHIDDPDMGEGEIAEVFQRGFTLGDKVVRCAMVKVAN